MKQMKWAWAAVLTLAKQELDKANSNREEDLDWPTGMTWDKLTGSSRGIFVKRAVRQLDIPYIDFIEATKDIEIDERSWELK